MSIFPKIGDLYKSIHNNRIILVSQVTGLYVKVVDMLTSKEIKMSIFTLAEDYKPLGDNA